MPAEEGEAEVAEAPRGLFARVREWSTGHPKRATGVAVAFVAAAVGTVVGWLALAELATQPEDATIELALRALDDGENELAKAIVERMQTETMIEGGYGGPLFVLGAIKTRDAEAQWSVDRKRSEYFIASRYLSEARTFGFPEGRGSEGLYLLGKSLIESRQLKPGIAVLLEALETETGRSADAYRLLAEAYYFSPKPNYDEAVAQLDRALADASLGAPARVETVLRRAEALTALGRYDEADAAIESLDDDDAPARRRLVRGRLAVARLENTAGAPRSLAEIAERSLREARRLDKLSTGVSRESAYYLARVEELSGRSDEALAGYDELRRNHGSSPAGIAAALAEGDLLRQRKRPREAIEAYRRVLDALQEPVSYQGTVLPLSEVRTRLLAAHEGFVERGDFPQAIELVDHLDRLVARANQLEMRAKTLNTWGERLLGKGARNRVDDEAMRLGLDRLRSAGLTYEDLAEVRFATERFTDDLWAAADAYFRGQSYSNAVRVLDRYLRHEPESRNALAQLRLGEAYLSLGRPRAAIAAFEECLEFHPNEGPSYRARVEGARAYQLVGQHAEAERLLRENLSGSAVNAMTPQSPEWRDSLFELGRLQASQTRYDEAIDTLREAIDRYPDDPQKFEATYLVAEAHRHAANKPLAEYRAANTVNERERARAAADEHLEAALELYDDLQREITRSESQDELDRVTQRNCYMLTGAVLFELGRYEEAIASFSRISTLYQNEPFLLEAIVQISHCWRRLRDPVRAAGAVQQARDLLARLPDDADFATSTNLSRNEWNALLAELAEF